MTEERNIRHWLLIARRGEGKSTFAAAMSPEYLVADLDGRWTEQREVKDKSRIISQSDPLEVVNEMEKLRPQLSPYVRTLIYDSGTAVLDFIQSRGRLQEAAVQASGGKYNGDNVNRMKADTMRLLSTAALRWHCDVLWIFHIEDGKYQGKDKERVTISNVELDRLKKSLNGVLTIVRDPNGRRGIRIEWSRYNNSIASGQIIWDMHGMWKGVPEKLDDFLANYMGNEGYNGNVYSDQWLMQFLGSKGVTFKDTFDMYQKLDIKETPAWYNRNAWAALIKKALPEPTK
jgi:hypothetical protein